MEILSIQLSDYVWISREKNDPNDSYMGHIYAILLQSIIKIIFFVKGNA